MKKALIFLTVLMAGIAGISGFLFLTATQDLQHSKARVAELEAKQEHAPAAPAPAPAAEVGLARALKLLPVEPSTVVFTAKAGPSAYLFVTNAGPGNGTPHAYWFADADKGKATKVAEHGLGPAPQFTFIPYDLGSDQAHVRTVDGWEGYGVTHDDYVDIKTGDLIISTHVGGGAVAPSVLLERGAASTTVRYVYTGCGAQKDDGKKVTVTGVTINGTRTLGFAKPYMTTCAFSEMNGEATPVLTFDLPYFQVNPTAMSFGSVAGHTVVVPLESIGSADAVILKD